MNAGRDWSQTRVVGVARLANYLKRKIEADANLSLVGVEGEISGLRVQPSGTWNFTIKDRDAVLDCFAFPSDAATFPAAKAGDAIVAYGKVSTYEKKSSYQLVVRHVELAGVGALYARYEELRRKLEAAGLFRPEKRRPLPRFPFRVALVGSPTGDGTRDFLTQARARAPHVHVELVPTAVQGDVAPQIIAALQRACTLQPDLVVLARGGGSFEDLFVFSDERLVRAVAACPIPIVTAIGHEADSPLVDFAADHRAPTPSTAAQTILPSREELLRDVQRDGARAGRAFNAQVGRLRSALDRIEVRSPLADPTRLLASRRQTLDAVDVAMRRGARDAIATNRERLQQLARRLDRRDPNVWLRSRRAEFDRLRPLLALRAASAVAARRLTFEQIAQTLSYRFINGAQARVYELRDRLDPALLRALSEGKQRLAVADAKLNGVDPDAPLRRGYAMVRDAAGRLVVDAASVAPGTRLAIQVARGTVRARVEGEDGSGMKQIGLF